MKMLKNEFGKNIIVPSEQLFICRIDDKLRYEREMSVAVTNPDMSLDDIEPIYKCPVIYAADNTTLDDYMHIFVEID